MGSQVEQEKEGLQVGQGGEPQVNQGREGPRRGLVR